MMDTCLAGDTTYPSPVPPHRLTGLRRRASPDEKGAVPEHCARVRGVPLQEQPRC